MNSLAALSHMTREGGMRVVTLDAEQRPVARSVLYPDGDLTTIVRPDITERQQAEHVRALEAQVAELARARRHMITFLSTIGGTVALVATGVGLHETWMSGAGGAGACGLLYAAWRFRKRIRG